MSERLEFAVLLLRALLLKEAIDFELLLARDIPLACSHQIGRNTARHLEACLTVPGLNQLRMSRIDGEGRSRHSAFQIL